MFISKFKIHIGQVDEDRIPSLVHPQCFEIFHGSITFQIGINFCIHQLSIFPGLGHLQVFFIYSSLCSYILEDSDEKSGKKSWLSEDFHIVNTRVIIQRFGSRFKMFLKITGIFFTKKLQLKIQKNCLSARPNSCNIGML